MSSAAAAAASRSKLKQQALFARIPLQPTTNAAAPRLHLLCSRSFFRPRPCEASRHDQLAAAATVCAAMHSARRLLLGQGHAATRGMRTNEDGVAASLPVQSQRLHPSHCHTPGPSARCCGLQHQQRAACPCAPALHTHPLCILPRTISRHFQHGALAPLSRGCNTNAAPPPASPLPSAAHEALRRATTPRGWPRRRWIYFRKQTKCRKKARAAARRYSMGLRGA